MTDYKDPGPAVDAAAKRDTQAADAKLERIYQIAEDLAEYWATSRNGRAPGKPADVRRAGRRIMNLVNGVDEDLGI